jgi:hypothetical protein
MFGIGVSVAVSGGGVSGGFVMPIETAFEPTNPVSGGTDSNPNIGFRVVATLAEPIGSQFRVTLRAGSAGGLISSSAGFGKQSALDVATDDLVPITWNDGSTSFSIAANAQITSDWMNPDVLVFAAGDEMMIGFTTGASGHTGLSGSNSNVTSYFGAAGDVLDADPNYAASANNCFALVSIETRGTYVPVVTPPEVDLIPMTFDSALFTGMNEVIVPVALASNEDLDHTSIIEASGGSTIFCAGGNEISLCRVDSRECVRITVGDVSINQCYLEATGEGEDHADTIQIYATGATGGTISLTNSMIVAHQVAATAGFLAVDGWSGTINISNTIFQDGPIGLKVAADAPGGEIILSLDDVYFVDFTDNLPIQIQELNGGILTITQWSNVREASIVEGELVLGRLIPRPAL